MKIDPNYKFSSILWISHFLTDAIAMYALTIISINIFDYNNFILDKYIWLEIVWYFILYNFLAFFLQIFLWYFLDKIKDNNKYFKISKKIILTSFLFYIIWSILLYVSFILSIIFIWIWSCLFHLWSWNISLIANKNKATNLWIFASGGVIWLSFWWFSAIFFPQVIILINIFLLILWKYILSNNNYKIEEKINLEYNKLSPKINSYLPIIIWLLLFILIIRSTIWTNFQIDFISNKWIIFYLAISAFLWKIIWWILEDNKHFKEKYFIVTWFISFLLIFIYSFYFQNLIVLLLWIFWIQIFVSPITIIIYKLIPKHRSKLIGFTFWLSLVLWFLFLNNSI